jgi:tetrahydromethanopterin S-methyltransferase subunit G
MKRMENLEAPKTIEEVGIHLMYMSSTLKEMKKSLDASQANHVPISVFIEHKDTINQKIKSLEEETEAIQTFISSWLGKVRGINFTIGIVIGGIMFVISNWHKFFK